MASIEELGKTKPVRESVQESIDKINEVVVEVNDIDGVSEATAGDGLKYDSGKLLLDYDTNTLKLLESGKISVKDYISYTTVKSFIENSNATLEQSISDNMNNLQYYDASLLETSSHYGSNDNIRICSLFRCGNIWSMNVELRTDSYTSINAGEVFMSFDGDLPFAPYDKNMFPIFASAIGFPYYNDNIQAGNEARQFMFYSGNFYTDTLITTDSNYLMTFNFNAIPVK